VSGRVDVPACPGCGKTMHPLAGGSSGRRDEEKIRRDHWVLSWECWDCDLAKAEDAPAPHWPFTAQEATEYEFRAIGWEVGF